MTEHIQQRARNKAILDKVRHHNRVIVQRRVVDDLFDIHHREADPEKALILLRIAARESQVYEQLLADDDD